MNRTRNALINQRIEKISCQHAVVGIDIAKDKHVAQVTDFRNRVLTPRAFTFSNSGEGFLRFQRWLEDVQAKHHLPAVLIGMEPTGHYWFNLANWLLEQSMEVVLVNPVLTHRNKENRDNSPSKNDSKDSMGLGMIAQAALLGFGGDLSRYQHGRQLLRRAGLNLAECTSGTFKGKIKISKRGDRALRKHLYLAMLQLVRHHADFASGAPAGALYWGERAEFRWTVRWEVA
jgi:transposase